MPTQIMSTPTIKGTEAQKVIQESKRTATKKTQKGSKKLEAKFKPLIK